MFSVCQYHNRFEFKMNYKLEQWAFLKVYFVAESLDSTSV